MSILDELYTSFIYQPTPEQQAAEEAAWQKMDIQVTQNPQMVLHSMMETDPAKIAATKAAIAEAQANDANSAVLGWALVGGAAFLLFILVRD